MKGPFSKKTPKVPAAPQTEAERLLSELYSDRLKDRSQSVTRRRKAVEKGPEKMSSLMSDFFHGDAEASKRLSEGRALIEWEKIVGPSAARASRALRVRGTQLVVKVTDPMWMQQLMLLKHEILKKYWKALPGLKLTDIFFSRY